MSWRTLFLLVATAWAVNAQAAIELRDDRGLPHRFEQPVRRIVSLLPSLTESVCALGGCDRLVGVDRWSDHPAQVQSLPRLGGLEDAPVERILALRPDVVLAASSARATERLAQLGVVVVYLDSNSHADVRRSMRLIAAMLGTPQAADRAEASITKELAGAAAQVPSAWRGRSVYFEIGSGPYAAGAASFIGETLARLGLVNLVPASMGPFPKLNPEFVLRGQPDLIIAGRRDLQALPARPGWSRLQAVAHQRSCGLDEAGYELLTRPGPRLGEAARAIADCLSQLPAPAR